MPSDDETGIGKPSVVFLVLLGTALGFAESFLPRPIPFMKPGFANTAGVIAAVTLGTGGAFRVNLTRAVAVAIATGSIATPAFGISLAGAAAASLAMGPAGGLVPGALSATGLSVAGSAANMAAQLTLASVLFPGLPVASFVPMAAAWSLLSGVLVGIASTGLMRSGLLTGNGSGLVRKPSRG
ncbi:MAG: Gx transporter family protein [Candidatus Fermentibacter daniensis]|nr:Gx transporter family protein [Candidatus Fermentibacter daniensis]